MASKTETSVYQIKVTLKDVKPPVWRRFLVKEDITLYEMHHIIQAVMGWYGGHLYQFVVGERPWPTYYGEPHNDYGGDMKDASRVKLNKLAQREGYKFVYEYDFGDGWEHQLLVEKILKPEKDVRYPLCIKGKRACPPEDCGGPWGYEELLETISNPEDEDYEERMEWLGETFDPEKFDLDAINARLQRMG